MVKIINITRKVSHIGTWANYVTTPNITQLYNKKTIDVKSKKIIPSVLQSDDMHIQDI